MKKVRPDVMVSNLAVVRHLSHHHGEYLPQWHVATVDGMLIFGPFLSLEQAIDTARAAQNIQTEVPTSASAGCSGNTRHSASNVEAVRLTF
jgi:hypothetical protein